MPEKKVNINEDIVKRFMQGDKYAFDLIFNSYHSKIYGFVYKHLKIKEDSKEIVQEVFVKLWEHRQKIHDLSLFNSYIFSIAYNTTISYLREKIKVEKYVGYVKSLQANYKEDKIVDRMIYTELKKEIESLINNLPSRQKEVYILSRKYHLSYKEISDKLKISVKTVEIHMSRALSYLRRNLKGE